MVDGMMAGSAPGVINITPGPHRIRIERPMVTPFEKFVVVKPGMSLNIPLSLSPEGRRQWQQQTRFFEELKDGAVLRDSQMKDAEAAAQFMRNSSVNIDTSNVQRLEIDEKPSLWQRLMKKMND